MSCTQALPRAVSLATLMLAAAFVSPPARAADCNNNTVDDAAEILGGASPDCNGNGIPDECDAAPTLAVAQRVSIPLQPVQIVAADFNGDGQPDIATANEEASSISVLLNQGGAFAVSSHYGVFSASSLVARDLDGDGDVDLAAAGRTGAVSVMLNGGDGAFGGLTGLTAGFKLASIVAADLDGDGDVDLAVTDAAVNEVVVLRNGGNASFAALEGVAVGLAPHGLAAEDVNSDGAIDLIATNVLSDSISVCLNGGDGTIRSVSEFATGDSPYAVATGDLDGDGDADLVVANQGNDGPARDSASILLNSGDGQFGGPLNIIVGDTPRDVLVADADGDGQLDAVVANRGSDSMTILRNVGGTFEESLSFPAGQLPASVVMADIDGDGDADAVAINQFTHDVVVLRNDSLRTSGDCNANAVPDDCEVDDDNDGIINACDSDDDDDGTPDSADPDQDGDGIPNERDNCPAIANSDQLDSDGNRIGDACTGTDGKPLDPTGGGVPGTGGGNGGPTGSGPNPAAGGDVGGDGGGDVSGQDLPPPVMPRGCGAGACGAGIVSATPLLLLWLGVLKGPLGPVFRPRTKARRTRGQERSDS